MARPAEIPYEIVLRGAVGDELSVEDFANFLRDLVFLHDRLWMIASRVPRKSGQPNRSHYYHSKWSVPDDQKLHLDYIKMESPLEIGLTIASAILRGTVALAYAKAIETLVLLPGKKRKQDLEVERLEDEREGRKRGATQAALQTISETSGESMELHGNDKEEAYRWIKRDIEKIPEHGITITQIEIRKVVKPEEK